MAHTGQYQAAKVHCCIFRHFAPGFPPAAGSRPWWDFLHENKWETRASPFPTITSPGVGRPYALRPKFLLSVAWAMVAGRTPS